MTGKSIKSSGVLHDWLITIAIIFISIFGVILALICIYALPNQTVKPLSGAAYFICSAVSIGYFLLLRWKKETTIFKEEAEPGIIIVKETISDKILKWIVTVYALFFVLDGFAVTMICIYALPDKTTQPMAGLLYFLSGCIVLATFVFVVWKNGSTKTIQA